MRNSIKRNNEKIENQNQAEQKINKFLLPSIKVKNNEVNIIHNNYRNPQSANISNKLLNNAIEIGKKMYNRDIITPNLVNIYTFLDKNNIMNNNSKSSPKRNINYVKNKKRDKYKIDTQNKYIYSFLNDNQNQIETERNKINNDWKLITNKMYNNNKELLQSLNNRKTINKYLNSKQTNIINKNNNNKNKEIYFFSKINNNNSSNQIKNIEVPYLLKEKTKKEKPS